MQSPGFGNTSRLWRAVGGWLKALLMIRALPASSQPPGAMAERVVDARTRALQEPATKLIAQQHVEPSDDIKAERSKATFDVTHLLNYLNDGADKVKRR